MTGRKRWLLLTIWAFSMLFLLRPAVGMGAKTAADRCTVPDLAAAAAILGVAPDSLQRSSSDIPVSPADQQRQIYRVPPYACYFRVKNNFVKTISYQVYPYRDPRLARQEFARMRDNFATVARVDAVPGLGDQAFHVVDRRFRRLVAVKGGTLVDILSPGDFSRQQRVMRLVLQQF